MDIKELVTDQYAIYNGDCIEVMPNLPDESIHLSVYSPPFADLYTYSSSDNDLGNNASYEEFLEHYEYVIRELFRVTMPGRMTAVHCMDIPRNGDQGLVDFPGDIIKLHDRHGFKYWDRKNIWKEPLRVAIRTRQRALMHQQLVDDTAKCRGALADYVLIFKKRGDNPVPIAKPYGMTRYAGDFSLMNEEERREFQGYQAKYSDEYTEQQTNRLSQFIWRRYASSAWEDIRGNEMLEYKPGRDKDDERHVCPLHLDIIERIVALYTNRGEKVLTPFMGIGSEVYKAVAMERKGIGIELKESYFRQSVKNLRMIHIDENKQQSLFDTVHEPEPLEFPEK